ncbi:hypothetical protein [Actinomadura roseirufa]|uniref:hypothetical protein n=1 Tax=Actinomadura roseirufa TaxID=2094049 RepID=UPI001041872D|nr:hypothetical protein [Actinomadura roseirufa]
MSERQEAPFADAIEIVAGVLNAYSPGQPSDQQGPASAERVQFLLTDLIHYCDHHHIDFPTTMAAARTAYADDRAEDHGFVIGDEVQPRQKPLWRGIVTGGRITRRGEVLCAVHIPGERHELVVSTAQLEKAPPFGSIKTQTGIVSTVQEAEERLDEVTLTIRHAQNEGWLPEPALYQEQERLIDGLALWSGSSAIAIHLSTGPRIAAKVQAQSTRKARRPALMHRDFPQRLDTQLTERQPEPAVPKSRPSPDSRAHRM